MSFMRKPPPGLVGSSTPGVVTKKLSVSKKMPEAAKLAYPETTGSQRRVAMSNPVVISTTPITFEAPCTLVTAYIQDKKGECDTKSRMPSASNEANLKPPHITSKKTSP